MSSQLDIDRLDYLKRDSFFTGVTEGSINTDRIIAMMSVENENEFIVKVPNSSNHTHLEVGEETIVSWTSDDCRALDIGTF